MRQGLDYIGVCVVYFCHDSKGNFVMAKRSQNARDEKGRWDIGGGAVEFGQTIDETLKKEIKEEYSTDVVNYELLGFSDVHREHEGNKSHWISLDFKVLITPEQVKIGEPHKFDDLKWFTMDKMLPPEQVHSQLPYFLEKYKNKL